MSNIVKWLIVPITVPICLAIWLYDNRWETTVKLGRWFIGHCPIWLFEKISPHLLKYKL